MLKEKKYEIAFLEDKINICVNLQRWISILSLV